MDPQSMIRELASSARSAWAALAGSSGAQRDTALKLCAQAIRDGKGALQAANEKDLARSGEFGLTEAMIDRLRLTDAAVAGADRRPGRSDRPDPHRV